MRVVWFKWDMGARMHSLPFCTRIACVLTERARSAPRVLGSRSAHGRYNLTASPPSPATQTQVRPAPPHMHALRPPLTVSYILERFPPGPDGRPRVDYSKVSG
eukprot:2675707-Pleurochrysis_carterae.AAC.1